MGLLYAMPDSILRCRYLLQINGVCARSSFSKKSIEFSQILFASLKFSHFHTTTRKFSTMDVFEDTIIDPLKDFYYDSSRFVENCRKPDWSEFSSTAIATLVGFLIIGAIGFFVKLIHIPINNIIVGGRK